MRRDSSHEILAFLVLGFAAFLWLCLATHHPLDLLSLESPVRNACGPLGARLSGFIVRWIGTIGSYGLATLASVGGLLILFRRGLKDPGWKAAGAVLLLLALSCFEVAFGEHFVITKGLPGGYYGQFFYGLLLGQLSAAGTYLLLAVVVVIAFLISTDAAFYPAVARAGGAVFDPERWQGLSESVREKLSGAGWLKKLVRKSRETAATFRLHTPKPTPKSAKRKKKGAAEQAGASGGTATKAAQKRKSAGAQEVAEDEDDDEYEYEYVDEDEAEGDDEYEYEYVDEDEDEEQDEDGEEGDEYEYEYVDEDEAEGDDEYEYEYVDEDEDEEQDEGGEVDEAGEDDDEEESAEVEEDEEEAKKAEPPRPPLKIRCSQPVVPASKQKPKRAQAGPYRLPPLEHLAPPKAVTGAADRGILERMASKIEETLGHFKIEARVVEVQMGPTITQYEVSPAAGIKVNRIINLADDLAMALKAQSIRIVAPIPGKSTVGIEVPNKHRNAVSVRELIESEDYREAEFRIPLTLGRDVAGNPVIADLGDMPHLLIAGSTGSGKSVCINSIILNLLLARTPDEVKLILVDPKMVELAQYENIPHLLAPVVTDMKKAPAVLNWMVDKMEERYELLALAGVRHISSFNALGREKLEERLKGKLEEEELAVVPERLPYMVIIIDELADLMMTASKEVEASITRLSQKSRAVGIHVILATQRPSVDVITGLIKANMPCRISFHVASRVDSRTILDRNGAEKLLGKGDMLYLPPGTSQLKRVQGTFISDKEIREVVDYVVQQAEPQFSPELTRFGVEGSSEAMEQDELYEKAVRIVLGSQRGSVTLLQRQLQIGYTRASRLMELMNEQGLVGPFKGSKAREVYYTLEDWETAHANASASTEDTE